MVNMNFGPIEKWRDVKLLEIPQKRQNAKNTPLKTTEAGKGVSCRGGAASCGLLVRTAPI